MKKLIISIMLLLPLSLMAEKSSFESFYDKYSGKDNYTSVDITPEFLKMIIGFSGDDDLKRIASNIERIRIIVSEEYNDEFTAEAAKLVANNKLYKNITTVKSGGESTSIYVIQKENQIIDFLMLVVNDIECVVINVTGKNLDINQVSNLTKNVKIKANE